MAGCVAVWFGSWFMVTLRALTAKRVSLVYKMGNRSAMVASSIPPGAAGTRLGACGGASGNNRILSGTANGETFVHESKENVYTENVGVKSLRCGVLQPQSKLHRRGTTQSAHFSLRLRYDVI